MLQKYETDIFQLVLVLMKHICNKTFILQGQLC